MSENPHQCLNCGHTLTGRYCVNCGQKADTHRITTRHFIMHDLLHGTLHIEKGLFFTIIQVLKHRGQTALDYISGKRIRYYNVFYLSLILLSLNILAVVFKHRILPDTAMKHSGEVSSVFVFAAANMKFIVLTFIPFMALNSLILFRRKKHNYAEHVVAAGFCMVAALTLALIANLILLLGNITFFSYLGSFVGFLVFLTPLFFYFSYSAPQYRFWGYSWRILLFYVLFILQVFILILLLSFAFTGELNISGEINLN
ncbi:MAG: hypothetical protein MUC87_12690 [Bacteroidia bacterium]|jgi:hypothetical protein|nr:hypothetical protein [Bacteroidia bacterium]